MPGDAVEGRVPLQMTAHELARALLAGPDDPVMAFAEDAADAFPVAEPRAEPARETEWLDARFLVPARVVLVGPKGVGDVG